MKYYRLISENNMSRSGTFDYTAYLPKADQPGAWTPDIEGTIEPCERGYHVTDARHLLDWADAQLYECEVKEPVAHVDGGKWACRSIRLTRKIEAWNPKTLRLFACWCARQVWRMLTDERSRNAVEVAEKFANGKATADQLSAARDAAWAAAWAAARAAARDAAWDAARDAAWDAARSAARDAARAAAWAAARDAAWDAARDAARAAALAAALDAALDAQINRLLEELGIVDA